MTTPPLIDPTTPVEVSLRAVQWPEIGPGDDLVELLISVEDLRDGDIAVVTSKVVSKAEGRLVTTSRTAAIDAETRRVVARRGPSVIAETRHGLVMAAAGVDASNTPAGTVLLLPLDPDASARGLRAGVYAATGRNIAVIISDTAGRAWRIGQTDLAIGCAGLLPARDLAGTRDTHGNELQVTIPVIADEMAAAADLVKGKATGRPVAIVRGLAALVLSPGDHGPGAGSLVRSASDDLFGLGVREAAAAAAHREAAAIAHFPRRIAADPDPFGGLVESFEADMLAGGLASVDAVLTPQGCRECPTDSWLLAVDVPDGASEDLLLAVGRLLERADVLAAAARLRPHRHVDASERPRWHRAATMCWQDCLA